VAIAITLLRICRGPAHRQFASTLVRVAAFIAAPSAGTIALLLVSDTLRERSDITVLGGLGGLVLAGLMVIAAIWIFVYFETTPAVRAARAGIKLKTVENTSFEWTIGQIARTAKCAIDLKGFTDDQVKARVRDSLLSATTVPDAILAVRPLVKLSPFPEYRVEQVGSILRVETMS